MADIVKKQKEFLAYVEETHVMGQLMDQVFRQIEKENRVMTPVEKRLVRTYEARHKKIQEAVGAHPGSVSNFEKK